MLIYPIMIPQSPSVGFLSVLAMLATFLNSVVSPIVLLGLNEKSLYDSFVFYIVNILLRNLIL